MIGFRCWYCSRLIRVEVAAAGEVRRCGCGSRFRVPAGDGGDSRYRTLTDRLVELVVYGGGGALLGFGLALLLLRFVFIATRNFWLSSQIMLACMLIGLLAGALLGEAGVTMVGGWIRTREKDEHPWL